MFACEVREGSVTRQVKTLDNVGQFIMKKLRRLARHRGFSVPAARETCVMMGDRVRHTARLQCQGPKGVSNFKLERW